MKKKNLLIPFESVWRQKKKEKINKFLLIAVPWVLITIMYEESQRIMICMNFFKSQKNEVYINLINKKK